MGGTKVMQHKDKPLFWFQPVERNCSIQNETERSEPKLQDEAQGQKEGLKKPC